MTLLNSRTQENEMMSLLQPTAVTFTPLGSREDDTLPLNGQQRDIITPDGSDPSHVVFQDSGHLAHDKPELTHSKTDTDCIFCISLGRPLGCCKVRTNSRPCPECAELSQLFARESKKYEDETIALRDKPRRLEEESPEDKFIRLCVEKNAKIEELMSEVEKTNKEDELLKAENKDLEKTLKRLEADVKKAQPAADSRSKRRRKERGSKL